MTDIDVEAIRNDPEFQEFRSQLLAAATKQAVGTIYAAAKELRKRPLLREVLEETASNLDGLDCGLEYQWPSVKAYDCHPDDRVAERLRHMRDPRKEGVVLTTEFAIERARVDNGYEDLESRKKRGDEIEDETNLIYQAMEATIGLQHKTLLAIKDGRVDPVEAAKAALGTEAV